MGSEWTETILGSVLSFSNGRSSPERSEEGAFPVYGSNGIIGFSGKTNSEEDAIIIGRVGTYCGSLYYSKQKCWVTDNAIRAIKRDDNASRYLYYLLISRGLNSLRGGSGQPLLNQSTLNSIPVVIPPPKEQHAIACVLGALDDKIELNQRMNKNLEETAQAIFKSWFVDFDPVHYKAAGQDPPGLAPHIADLFPDALEGSELGEIPKGWKVGAIKDCCSKIHNGGTPKRNEPDYWSPGTIPWLTSGEVRQTIITRAINNISEVGLANSSAKWLPAESTVVALYGATAGQVSFITEKLTTNQAVCGLIPKSYHRYYNYLLLRNSVSAFENLARGSAQQNISKEIVETIKVVIPDEPVLNMFDGQLHPIFMKWVANLLINVTLTTLRDALLPKLISGELPIPDAERIVERCM